MAMGDRVRECIDKLNQSDYENALIQLSIAFDGTAKREYPKEKKVGKRFKRFLRDTQDIITYFTFAVTFLINCQHDGYILEDIIYKVLRCGLLHEGSIPDEIEFVDQIVWGRPNGKWTLPKSYMLGGLLQTVASSAAVFPYATLRTWTAHLACPQPGKKGAASGRWNASNTGGNRVNLRPPLASPPPWSARGWQRPVRAAVRPGGPSRALPGQCS